MSPRPGFDAERLRRIGTVLREDIERGLLPGAVILLCRAGRLAERLVLGTLGPAGAAPMRADALFRIYSMTKPLTSVAVLMLMEQGGLSLTDPVADYLPGFAQMRVARGDRLVAAKRAITLYDLLTRHSGFTYGERSSVAPIREAHLRVGLAACPRDIAPEDFCAGLAAAPLLHQPGTAWEYGPSTDVLGLVVERVTGQRLSAFLAERLFAPLGMADTVFSVAAEDLPRLAEPFAGTETLFDASRPPQLDAGGAGALSTAGDYLRFAEMLRGGGRGLLSPASLRLMLSDHLGGDDTPGQAAFQSPGYGYGFGLGVGVRLADGGAAVPGSAGEFFWPGTAGTTFFVDPARQLSVVFMAQAPGQVRLRYRRLVRQLVYRALDATPTLQEHDP